MFSTHMAFTFHSKFTLKCCLQFVSIWTSLKFFRLVMGQAPPFRTHIVDEISHSCGTFLFRSILCFHCWDSTMPMLQILEDYMELWPLKRYVLNGLVFILPETFTLCPSLVPPKPRKYMKMCAVTMIRLK